MKIFCSGIGGIGLSAYASLQQAAGHAVSGTDRSRSALLEDLESQGIGVSTDQSGAQVPTDADLFVYSEAIPATSPERVRAAELGIRQVSYPHALGELSAGKRVIAVCGTHGKSSTTGMASRLLITAGKDPEIVVGTKLRELAGRNWKEGSSDLFLLEACEYRRSFHFYEPSVILLTNCDGDHYDYYATKDEYRDAFVEFVKKLPPDGVLITHLSDPDCKAVADAAGKRTVDADTFPLIPLHTPGKHMQQNARLVLALAAELGIPTAQAEEAVSGYAGSWRRMEVKGEWNGATVIDDYAHHPVEIRATLEGMKSAYAPRRIVCVYQPHTHDRTLKLYADFLGAFADADLVLLTSVYEARKDMETARVDLEAFAADIRKTGTDVRVTGSLADTERVLPSVVQSGDVIVCMGAGDITGLATRLVT
jgi:UDP-N-acetylmuramate--alanine ligase